MDIEIYDNSKKAIYFGNLFHQLKVEDYIQEDGLIDTEGNEWNKDIKEVQLVILEKQQKYLKRVMDFMPKKP